ncbi:hypothetical protein JZU46_03165 [bacterium]|nr:hypothetical protein [bacterium]
MEFRKFKSELQRFLATMLEGQTVLFVVDVDKEVLWNTYLDSFPEDTNPIYRERREHDCSCCRQFIKNFGNVVAIRNGKMVSMWDLPTSSAIYGPVAFMLSKLIHASKIQDIFVTKELVFGTDKSVEAINGDVVTWHHFYAMLPKHFRCTSSKTVESIMGEHRSSKGVLERSFEEISQESLEIVLDLIAQNSLYKGDEWKAPLDKFLELHKAYHKLDALERSIYCWSTSMTIGPGLSKIKNHSIGVLLTDITEGMDLDAAVRRYEKIVAPSNYKRPKAIFTKGMIEQAEKTIAEMGLLESLRRRFATLDDITVNNILFANRDAAKRIGGSIFDEMKADTGVINARSFDKVEQINIEDFIANVLPNATFLEAFVENAHMGNLVSLIAPEVKDSKTMFKWDNNFCWAYNGNITDSMRENVKAAGGNVDGVLRFSIQWNDNGDNQNDFDAHCHEPKNGTHIYFSNKGIRHRSSGMLDVDIISPGKRVAVENIIYTSLADMPKGIYEFGVKTYSYNGGQSGFSAELEFNGQTFSFEHRKPTRTGEVVPVVKVEFNGTDFRIVESLESSVSSREVWGVKTNQFVPVSVCMFSPNYWDDKKGIGHKHYCFMLKGCKNDTSPNGFFNEFLKEDLNPHRKVFEALGTKMKVADTPDQLSGIGFSSTKRNSLICKVSGKFNRVVKIVF